MATERMGQFWEFVYGSEIRGGDAVFRATSIIGGDQGGQYFLNQNESTLVPPYQGDSYKDAALEFTGDNNLLIIGGNYDSNFNPDYTVRTNKSGSPASRYNFEYVAGATVTEGGYAYRRDEIIFLHIARGQGPVKVIYKRYRYVLFHFTRHNILSSNKCNYFP